MRKTLLILGAGINQLTAIETAKTKGHFVIAVDPNTDAPGFAVADAAYSFDLADKVSCLKIAVKHHIDGVLTVASEYPMPLAAYIAETLSLPGLYPKVVSCATNKRLMRECFDKHGVPSPKSFAAKSVAEARNLYDQHSTHVIVKPAISHGGRGVKKIAPKMGNHIIDLAFERALRHSRNDEVLLEEFATGDEYSVEAITFNGVTTIIAVTKKYTSGSPFYVEIAHTQPSNLGTNDLEKIKKIVVEALDALGIDNSPTHTELKIDGNKISIIEVGARLGGGFISSHLVKLSTGVDLLEASIDLALGQSPNIVKKHDKGAAVGFVSAIPGRIVNIFGVTEARALLNIVEVKLYVGAGDNVEFLEDATDRIGHVIATGANAQDAEQFLANALKLVKLETRKS